MKSGRNGIWLRRQLIKDSPVLGLRPFDIWPESLPMEHTYTQRHTHTHTHKAFTTQMAEAWVPSSLAKGCLPSLSSHLQDQNHRWLEISKCWPCYGNPLWKVIHTPDTTKARPPQPLEYYSPLILTPPSPPLKSPSTLFFQGEAAQTCQ